MGLPQRDPRARTAFTHFSPPRGRRGPDGRWRLQNRHAGRTFFELETVGQPSRWNTLRALRVLAWYERARVSAPS